MEKLIVKKIQKRLAAEGYWVLKIHGGQYQRPGIPDILAIKNGLCYWIEVKVPGKGPTKLQEKVIRELRQAGCRAGVATCVREALEICEYQNSSSK